MVTLIFVKKINNYFTSRNGNRVKYEPHYFYAEFSRYTLHLNDDPNQNIRKYILDVRKDIKMDIWKEIVLPLALILVIIPVALLLIVTLI